MNMVFERVDWSEQHVELLKALWAEGLSATQITTRIPGSTRNGIIGKAHRLGLEKRRDTARAVFMRVPKPRANGNRHIGAVHKIKRAKASRIPDVDPAEQIVDLAPDQSDCAVPLMDAGDNCRWPLGEPTHDMLVCGAKPWEGLPYCARHCRIAYRPPGSAR